MTTVQDLPWNERQAFAGFDWAKDHHDLVVVDRTGRIVEDFRIDDTADGWQKLRERLAAYPTLAVTLETSSGAVVERLLEAGFAVYPVNPKSAERYRERKAPSGSKTDRGDAWSLADALRMDGHTWRRLRPDDPATVELRLLCRDEIGLIEQRTAVVCQLQAALGEYYPSALEAFDDWTAPASWKFLEQFPTPQQLAKAGKRRWEMFLHANRLYHSPSLYEKRMAIFARADQFCGSVGTTRAKSLLVDTCVAQLKVLEKQLAEYRRRIGALFRKHPDHDLFGSLPGAGEKLAPRLLAEIGDDRARFDTAEGLQCHAGTAPVNYQSGQVRKSHIRRACSRVLRTTVHLWANLSRARCPWAEAYYQQKKAQGKSHACALRCLGQRWLKILWKMWQTRTRYDADLHQRNQLAHGSWVLNLQPAASR